MDFMTAVKTCFNKYTIISGRARRSEFWWFSLFTFIVSMVLSFIDAAIFGSGQIGILGLIFSLAVLLPSICVAGRRLHDTNRSAWWLLIIFVPLIGILVLLWWYIQPGTAGTNDYGSDPLGGAAT